MKERMDDVAFEAQDLDTTAVVDGEVVVREPNAFELLGLAPELAQACADLGYVQPTAVQSQVVPKALLAEGVQRYADLMVSSQTGSGKTAAFLLPVMHTLIQQKEEEQARERQALERATAEALARGEEPPKRPKRKNPTLARHFKPATPGALVLCPTRELAQQVAQDAIGLVRHCRGLRIANVVGGMPYPVQIARLQNADLVVATPGRLLDLQRSGQIQLDQVKFLVVDEADRMLDLGFADDLAEVNNLTSQRRQTMMFSATFAPRIQQLAMRVMHDGVKHVQKVQIDTPQEQHANISQKLFWADDQQHKRALLDHWLRDAAIDQAVVFCSTQIECDGLANDLQQAGFAAVALHGALSQGIRNRRLMALRNGQVQFLVATDVAARGIDVPTITHVFNYGLPMKAEDYTHRIGRTGRAGRDGLAVTFAEFRDRRKISDIEAFTHHRIEVQTVAGLEPRQRPPQNDFGRGRGNGRPAGRGGDRFGDRRSGPRMGGGFGDARPVERDERRADPRWERPARDEAARPRQGAGAHGGFASFGRTDKGRERPGAALADRGPREQRSGDRFGGRGAPADTRRNDAFRPTARRSPR